MSLSRSYIAASVNTSEDLKTIAQSVALRDLSRLSLPEIEKISRLVGQIVPAGNVPGVILSGLARLPGRTPPSSDVRRDIGLLFRGVEKMLDKAVYTAFFAGPAAVIWGYQNLLRLAGKDPGASFPEGTWQFYVDYALREDTARHANETHGFDTLLRQHHVHLSPVDRITAWVMAAIHCLHQYDDLLANEWRERVYTTLLADIAKDEPGLAPYAHLYLEWQRQRPYKRSADAAPADDYPCYRRKKFDRFLAEATRELPMAIRDRWEGAIRNAEKADLPAYQRQMSLLSYLDPGEYGETRTPLPLERAHVGLIYRGRYYLIPACLPGTSRPADLQAVRAQIAALLHGPVEQPPAQLVALATCRRAALSGWRTRVDPLQVQELDRLRLAPVWLNCDPRPVELPLATIRQAERGVGDHALTIFDTGETFVFDQSHIYFDGGWGAALAEILTNEALSWAVYLRDLPPAQPGGARPYSLRFQFQPGELESVRGAPQVTPEAAAESETVNLKAILRLRKLFKRRSDLLGLTVNDLLVLYRAVHSVTYRPDPGLLAALQALAAEPATQAAAKQALAVLETAGETHPAILIPVDASQRDPRQRLYPMTFDVPLGELDFLGLHQRALELLDAYKSASGDRTQLYARFDELQRTYLSTLAGFGEVMGKAKRVAIAGESASVGTIKLLAHLPVPLQRLLDQVPEKIDLLNDIIKGREVFSNVGAVAPASTLTRFITAKDDNEKKTLAWGVITDASGVMRISLRDFRPHVSRLHAIGRQDLAGRIAQDYLESYAHGLNAYIQDLRLITISSRETRLRKEI